MGSSEHSFIPAPGVSALYYSLRCMVPYYSLSPYTSICFFTRTSAINPLILTPHPFPLPFKGRGRTQGDFSSIQIPPTPLF